MPWELEESARIDGCTPGQAFRKIMLPLAAPGLFTTAILAFIASWNEYLLAQQFSTKKTQTVTVAIANFTGAQPHQEPYTAVMAAGTIVTVPLIIMVLIFQRAIVSGLTAGRREGVGSRPTPSTPMGIFNPGGGTGGHPRARAQRLEMLLGIIGFFAFMAVVQTVVLEVRGEPAGIAAVAPRGPPRCCSGSLAAAARHAASRPRWGCGMTTIGDVAKAAGVSVATVSRALRGRGPGQSANPRPRPAPRRTELHYVASPAATSLVSGRTRGVGVITPYFNRWFFATVVSGIEKVLREEGYHVLLCDLEGHTFDTRLPITQTMLWKRADGAIILNVPPLPSERSVLDRLGMPVVTVGNRSRVGPRCGSTTGRDGPCHPLRYRPGSPRDRLRRNGSRRRSPTCRRPSTGAGRSPRCCPTMAWSVPGVDPGV